MAADQGFPEAQYTVADSYFHGKGVDADKNEAVKWFKRAAEQGLPEAQAVLQQLGF